MGRYSLGIDVGTTYTAAAVQRDGRAEMMPLGSTNVIVPTVVVLREDGEVLVGEVAERRAVAEPARVAREFKRRMGDPTPIVVGGTPYGAEALVAHVLRVVVREATAREGTAPDNVVLTHPASWSTFKVDLLAQAARMAGIESVTFLTEPQAAAIHYASQARLVAGATFAVYDLGGGTFDAAIVRRTVDGFELLGIPEGMERFGGIDIDRAVLAHVDDNLAGELAQQAEAGGAGVAAALARVRDDVRSAKEVLSNDSDAVVPVMLPGLNSEVRITRAELENMIRPRLTETIDALHRTVRSAGLDWADLTAILTVGGSSRIPLVREVVKERTGRPVVVDAHPKHAISLGAAQAGWQILNSSSTSQSVPPPPPPAPPPPAPPTSAPSMAAVMPPPPTSAAALAAAAVSAQGATPKAVAQMRSKRTALMVGGGVAAIALVLGVLALTRKDNSAASSGPANSAPAEASTPVTTAPSTTPPTTVVQTTLAPITVVPTTVPVAPPTGPTQNVADSTGSFIVSLPAGMATSTAPLTLSGVSFAHVSGSADLAGYLAGTWGSNGISVLATDASLMNASQAAALLSPGASCTSTSGEQPYTTPQGSGVLVEYNGCGGGAFAETIIAVNVPAANATVLVGGTGQAPSSAGLTSAIETVLASVRPQ
jgi:actin-like ATPase involved in cell morphogenesis